VFESSEKRGSWKEIEEKFRQSKDDGIGDIEIRIEEPSV